MLHSSKLSLSRKYDLPNLEQGTEQEAESMAAAYFRVLPIIMYERVKTCRQTVYLKPATSVSDSRQLLM
jgi:hypothetical protein